MKRREAIIKISWILKSAFLAPTILSVLQSCQEEVSKTENLLVFKNEQDDLVKAIADAIIPRTTSPSASDVKVNYFIDLLLAEVFDKEVKQKILNGLAHFDRTCQSITGNNFVMLSDQERYAYLEKLDREVMEQEYHDSVPFYYTFKHLTITSYFSTEEGVKQNLNYTPIPGSYIGEVALKDGDNIMIGNRM